ncbi:MAG: hypothetical protein KKE20_05575 [Nanoarchaeota archaeon]|nr:hypothetical protein [Nanoarchaeota archaeon]
MNKPKLSYISSETKEIMMIIGFLLFELPWVIAIGFDLMKSDILLHDHFLVWELRVAVFSGLAILLFSILWNSFYRVALILQKLKAMVIS